MDVPLSFLLYKSHGHTATTVAQVVVPFLRRQLQHHWAARPIRHITYNRRIFSAAFAGPFLEF